MTLETPDGLVRHLLALLRDGELDEAAALFADSVDFSIPAAPGIPWIAPADTPAGMRTFFGLLRTHLESRRFDVVKVIGDGSDVVALGSLVSRVKKTGRDIHSAFALHLTVEDQRITRYHMYEDSYAVAKAYFDD